MKLVCRIRSIYKGLSDLEGEFLRVFGIGVNGMIVLCAISEEKLSASQISDKTGMRASHLSKVLKVVEDKGLIERIYGQKDKRKMYFRLTEEGEKLLQSYSGNIDIPEVLKPMFKDGIDK